MFHLYILGNTYYIIGNSKEGYNSRGKYIETPYFPYPYPANYRADYILQSYSLDSHVLLLFLDFQISHQSFIEVSESDFLLQMYFNVVMFL